MWNFPRFCSRSLGPPCTTTRGILETDSETRCWEMLRKEPKEVGICDAVDTGAPTWMVWRRHIQHDSGGRKLYDGAGFLIGFTQRAPMHCSLCNGKHSGNTSPVFLLYNIANRFIVRFFFVVFFKHFFLFLMLEPEEPHIHVALDVYILSGALNAGIISHLH